jgi:hypothetical protein
MLIRDKKDEEEPKYKYQKVLKPCQVLLVKVTLCCMIKSLLEHRILLGFSLG